MTPTPGNPGSPDGGGPQSELQRTVGMLLATQQKLIDLRHHRDRELRVLDGIVRFSERMSTAGDLAHFWEAVADACVDSFDCETTIVLEIAGPDTRLLGLRGPGPEQPSQLAGLRRLLEAAMARGAGLIDAATLATCDLGAEPFAAMMFAAVAGGGRSRRLIVAAVTNEKEPFFPPIDAAAEPRLRLFATQVAALHEMQESRQQIQSQLSWLDRAHAALRESEDKYRHVFADAVEGLALIHCSTGIVRDVNAALARLCGAAVEDLVGKTPPWPSACRDEGGVVEVELTMREGGSFPVEVKTSRIEFGGERYRFCVVTDLRPRRQAEAEQRRLQEQMQQMRKMESVGRLAGGVAHDFNNLLTVISGNGELLRFAPLDDEQRQMIEEILAASRRAQALTQQLLTFSRKQVIRPQPADFNTQVGDALKLYRRLIGEDVELSFAPCAEPTPVVADAAQIGQVLANLTINARDAIRATGRPGRIDVRTELARDPAGAPAGEYVRLTVADNGVGMDAAALQHVFEPFFTTKGVGEGTGLGLATVFGIVQQNQGAIACDSAPGAGATFTVHWPLGRERIAVASSSAPGRAGSGRELVLLVEDDRGVREFASTALRGQGYEVRAAEGADEALAWLDGENRKPAILVTDVVMPRVNGKALAEMVRKRLPAIPVLFVSGYSEDILAQQGVLSADVALLEKPFTVAELSTRIRAMIDGAPA
jgi:PAS domain S-box-containing protein